MGVVLYDVELCLQSQGLLGLVGLYHARLRPQDGSSDARGKRDARSTRRAAVAITLHVWPEKGETHDEDEPAMTGGLAEEYTIAGDANNALVVPAGAA
jgi:hypothetical protein